jgi:hypothetical protein
VAEHSVFGADAYPYVTPTVFSYYIYNRSIVTNAFYTNTSGCTVTGARFYVGGTNASMVGMSVKLGVFVPGIDAVSTPSTTPNVTQTITLTSGWNTITFTGIVSTHHTSCTLSLKWKE